MNTNEAEHARAIATALQMQVDEMADELADLRAKLDVARRALEPFAEAASHLGPVYAYPPGARTFDGFEPMDFIRAHTALATIDEAQK